MHQKGVLVIALGGDLIECELNFELTLKYVRSNNSESKCSVGRFFENNVSKGR